MDLEAFPVLTWLVPWLCNLSKPLFSSSHSRDGNHFSVDTAFDFLGRAKPSKATWALPVPGLSCHLTRSLAAVEARICVIPQESHDFALLIICLLVLSGNMAL